MVERNAASAWRLHAAMILDVVMVLSIGFYVLSTSSIGLTEEEIPLRRGLGLLAVAIGAAYFIAGHYLGGTLWQRLLRAERVADDGLGQASATFSSSSFLGMRLTLSSPKPDDVRKKILVGFVCLGAVWVQFLPSTADEAYRAITTSCLLLCSLQSFKSAGTFRIISAEGQGGSGDITGNLALLLLMSLIVGSIITAWLLLKVYIV